MSPYMNVPLCRSTDHACQRLTPLCCLVGCSLVISTEQSPLEDKATNDWSQISSTTPARAAPHGLLRLCMRKG